MGKKQARQTLAAGTLDGLRDGDPEAVIDQKLVSAQNLVVTARRGYQQALEHRGQVVHLAHAAGWSKYRIAQRLGITRRAVDEALGRPMPLTPEQFLEVQAKQYGGAESAELRNLLPVLRRETKS